MEWAFICFLSPRHPAIPLMLPRVAGEAWPHGCRVAFGHDDLKVLSEVGRKKRGFSIIWLMLNLDKLVIEAIID